MKKKLRICPCCGKDTKELEYNPVYLKQLEAYFCNFKCLNNYQKSKDKEEKN